MDRALCVRVVRRATCICAAAVALAAPVSALGQQGAVVVNGVALDRQTVSQLEAAYQTPVRPGRYWYDPMSGLWGTERGPAAGQIHPGLRLGGPLKANASGGGTAVFINGRELHPLDVQGLQRLFGAVNPGRYWLNAMGIGGYEGGPPAFNLPAMAASQRGGAGYNRSTPFGHLGSDGRCSYYFDPKSGSSVMGGDC